MSNYKQSSSVGTSWQRACRVVIDNPLGGTPVANIVEEEVVSLGGKTITTPCSNLYVDFDPAAEIALIDPETGMPTGETRSHVDLYVMLHSLYIQAARLRDEQGATQYQGVR